MSPCSSFVEVQDEDVDSSTVVVQCQKSEDHDGPHESKGIYYSDFRGKVKYTVNWENGER